MDERETAIAQYKLIQNLIDLTGVSKILGTFIKAFLQAVPKDDGSHYLHGSFNQGGTVSGRLSSSGPNLTNLPSKSGHAEPVKQCFVPPEGFLWMGIDYNSLEDMISALTTRDPNKLKVYTGHVIYELKINGITHHIRDDATINYDGQQYTGEEFYAKFRADS